MTKDRLGARILEATRGALSIHLRSLSGTVSGRAGTRISVTGVSPELSIAPTGETSGDVSVGDPDFDRAMRAQGEPLETQALLDVETRARLQALFSTRDGLISSGHRLVSIEDGVLVVDCWDLPVATRAERLAVALEDALTLAQRLVTPPGTEERLAAMVGERPGAGSPTAGPEDAGPRAAGPSGDASSCPCCAREPTTTRSASPGRSPSVRRGSRRSARWRDPRRSMTISARKRSLRCATNSTWPRYKAPSTRRSPRGGPRRRSPASRCSAIAVRRNPSSPRWS